MNRRDVLLTTAAAAAGALLPREAGAEGPAGPTPALRLGTRRSADRGHANHGWLDTRHTFSFAGYHDPRWMGFRALRVINEDRVEPGQGFGWHPHQDMEILTYVLAGALEHGDSLGHGSVIVPGEVQRMSAGTGIRHREMNPSATEGVHFLQIWILPDRRGVAPSYAQKAFPLAERTGTLRLLASRDGREGSVTIHQDANVLAGVVPPGTRLVWRPPPGRHLWIQVARGDVTASGVPLAPGDGAFSSDPGDLVLVGGREAAEVLLFDLA